MRWFKRDRRIEDIERRIILLEQKIARMERADVSTEDLKREYITIFESIGRN